MSSVSQVTPVAPGSEPDRTTTQYSNSAQLHHHPPPGTDSTVMGSLRLIELQLVAFIMVISASGPVPLLHLIFPAFVTAYIIVLSRLPFPAHGKISNSLEIYQGSRFFRFYVIVGTTVGLFFPLAYILGGFARGDDHTVRLATRHLFLLSFQILTENIVSGLSLFSPPVQALVRLLYTVRRIFVYLDWIKDVWINKTLPANAALQRRNRCTSRQQQQSGGCNSHNNGENNKNEESKNNPDGVIVLGVYIHCEGCQDEVLRCLRGFEGVEKIEIDAKTHKVIVKGKKADPSKVAERLRKKSGKHVDLISPIPPKEEKKEEKKPEPPAVIEVVLKIYLHCEGCAKEVKHCIHKMEGVQTVIPEMEKNLVTVKGSMDAKKLVEFVNKRGGRHAEIVKETNTEKKKENNENENRTGAVYPNYPSDLVYAPQLFSDENPNSCFIM
ncbi:unnamed protein product [Fraxinus pennsylvanica]|uniref:HMA domain-containing protein n=1 Tax=Fraxinus pennsylvanica TaxID=56036 RepID=A0AAD2DJK6_9LAMI|nr:unnamed protein product [Fraxinus pennsylvanica]